MNDAVKFLLKKPLNAGETLNFAIQELEKFLGLLKFAGEFSVSFIIDAQLSGDSFRISGKKEYIIAASGERGMLYGAYRFLRELGIEFFSPDEFDTFIPQEVIALPELDITQIPRFALRGFFAVEKRDSEAFLLWMARHGLNYWTNNTNHPELCRKLGMILRSNPPSGTHLIFKDYLPPERYFADHPEFYALHGSERIAAMVPGNEWNICTSNPQAREVLVNNIIADLQPGGRLYGASALTMAPFDNGHWCSCENCRKSGNASARLLQLADYCVKRINQALPKPVTLIVSAYHETLVPPDVPLAEDFDYEHILIEFFPIERCYSHSIDDPECAGNRQLKEFFEAWIAQGRFRLMVCEYYNVSAFASVGLPMDQFMDHDLDCYKTAGGDAIAYMHVSTALWAQQSLTNCAYAAAAMNEKFSAEKFLHKRFGFLADKFIKIYDGLRRIAAVSKALLHYQGTGEMRSDNSNTVKFMLLVQWRNAAAGKPHEFYYPGHFEANRDNGSAISLATVLKILDETETMLETIPDDTGDAMLDKRIACEKMRFAYTADRIRFTAELTWLFELEDAGNQAAAAAMARRVRDRGERMRQEKLAPKYIREKGAPNYYMYFNALTTTRIQQIYAEKMLQYDLAIAPFAPEEGVEIKQG
ncbi:MAG: DUF4838 domain-containing protein [Lentisphaeria bacterium]|nr:DUF4838 domain-containing protein [Lentisphaeria bacterium]